MTYKEAIKILELMRPVPSRGNGKSFLSLSKNVALDIAIEALEKQIPKKPTRLTNKLLIDAGWTYGCPVCGCACGENKYHEDITADDIYCTQCGQRLE